VILATLAGQGSTVQSLIRRLVGMDERTERKQTSPGKVARAALRRLDELALVLRPTSGFVW
jgi:hypothetical protein